MSALASRTLTGPADYVGRQMDALTRAGLVVVFAPPRPHEDGIEVLVVLRRPAELAGRARQLPATAHAPATVRRLTPAQRRAAVQGGLIAGVLAAVAVAVWLIVRALSAAGSWLATNRAVVILAAVVLVVAGLLRLTSGRGRDSSGGSGCPGLVHHCAKCPDHR